MPQAEIDRVWALVDAQRATSAGAWTLLTLLKAAQEAGVTLTPADLWTLCSRNRSGGGESCTPPTVAEFVRDLLASRDLDAILDPWIGAGTLVATVAETVHAKRVVGFHPNADAIRAAEVMVPRVPSQYLAREIGDDTSDSLGQVALVVSDLPLGGPPRTFAVQGEELRDTREGEILLRSARLLRPDGVGVFVVSPRFLVNPQSDSVVERLSNFGLVVDAYFHVPEGAYRPLTMLARGIVVIRRGEPSESLFVGEVTTDAARRHTLLRNYRRRASGGPPALGTCVPLKGFQGYRRLSFEHRVADAAKRFSFPEVRLGEIALAMTRLRRPPAPEDVHENTVFLPLIATSRVRLPGEELPRGVADFVAIALDPTKADARMVAAFLESEFGRELREARASGAAIQRLRFDELTTLPLWLPKIEDQRRIVALDQRIRTLASSAADLREELWSAPNEARKIAERLDGLTREDSLISWADSLPFPVASILWTAEALADQAQRRYAQLDYFFEGLAEFLAVLLLSGTATNAEDARTEMERLRAILRTTHLSLARASFGAWVAIFENLAKRIRTDMSSGGELRQEWQRRMACDSADLLGALVSKPLVDLLKRANKCRNDWRGHGGVVGDQEAMDRAGHLGSLILEVRALVGHRWKSYPLVLPGRGIYSQGWHVNTASVVVGSRVPFAQAEFRLKQPLEHGVLHVVGPESGETCPLLPLIRISSAPGDAKNACYFFSRLDGASARYISYHHEGKPELTEAAPENLTRLTALLDKP